MSERMRFVEGNGDETQKQKIADLEKKLVEGEELNDQEINDLEVARDIQESRDTGMVLYEGIRDITAQQRELAKKYRDKGNDYEADKFEQRHPEMKALPVETLAELKERRNMTPILGNPDWRGIDRIYTGPFNFRAKERVTNAEELCATLRGHILETYRLELTASSEASEQLQKHIGKPYNSKIDKKNHALMPETAAIEFNGDAAESYQQHQRRAIETLKGFQEAAQEADEQNIVALVEQTLADIEQEKERVAQEVQAGKKE